MTSPSAPPSSPERENPEHEERLRLERVQARLVRAIEEADARLEHYARDIDEQKEYLAGNRDEMDHIEKISSRESIQQSVMVGDTILERKRRMQKLIRAPYFGRIDFAANGNEHATPVYVGIHHFHDDGAGETLVHDWRAPIASLFYDYETGPAEYAAPEGPVPGDIRLKRQLRIRDGEIELLIDTAVNVVDEVLQDELGRASDEGMKNIVATIQRDQNAIIRNDQAPVLIIQGVAGSGKTSIALHRIAYLLYRFKDELSSDDILIISPNRVFADYIANVLPELGEETVREIGMEALADDLLGGEYRFESFFEQTSRLVEKGDSELLERMRFKASPEFLRQLSLYASHIERERFQARDVWIARRLLPGWLLEEIFHKHRRMGMTERIQQVLREAESKLGTEYNYDLLPEERRELRETIRGMVHASTLRETYRRFYAWLGQPELFRTGSRGRLEYADVFPLIYLKMQLEGVRSPHRNIKHLLIDEMQDYTPVQYAVINRLFPCNKTILGDAWQAVNPAGTSTSDDIATVFQQASRVTLNKSYRSSYEITRFAQEVLPNPELIAIERHGEDPQVVPYRTRRDERQQIRERVEEFAASSHNTLCIICKLGRQAQQIHDDLVEAGHQPRLLTELSRSFTTGVTICTAHMAKGLEFDEVIIPDAGAKAYHTAMDRSLLYVACTRAMHRLLLTHVGEASPLLPSR